MYSFFGTQALRHFGTFKKGISMKDIDSTKHNEEHYLTFISIAVGSVALIAAIVWGITAMIRRRNFTGCC